MTQIDRRQRGTSVAAAWPSEVSALIAALASADPVARPRARARLVHIGRPAVPALIHLLSHAKPHARWEAAKALVCIADPIAATALVRALEDVNPDVRWVAHEGLVALGREGLQPLFAALLEPNHLDSLYEGAHHVCHALVGRRRLGPILRPVLAALEETEPKLSTPLAAYTALSRLRELP